MKGLLSSDLHESGICIFIMCAFLFLPFVLFFFSISLHFFFLLPILISFFFIRFVIFGGSP